MINRRIRWQLLQEDIGHLSAALKPVRSCEEVGRMMGVSATTVAKLEKSALLKIIRYMALLEQDVKTSSRHPERMR